MATSVLTPLQLNAGAGLLQNQGLGVNAEFTAAISAYENLPVIEPLLDTIVIGSTGNVGNTILSNATISSLKTLASNTCPALSDSVPSGYPTLIVSTNPPGFTGLLTTKANTYTGNGDVSKFVQAISIAEGYALQTNLFVNSAVNSQNYLGNTFTTTNSMITGDITDVNLATTAFGQDLARLGNLINLDDLGDLGSPLALVQQITSVAGSIPVLAVYFIAVGVPQETVVSLTDPTMSVTDSVQKLMYEAMTQITGTDLAQILQVLGVTTPGIATMADLLNPVKLFPNSFQSLTAPTANGLRAIYIDSGGTVNSALATELPPYVLRSGS
jgi:hypothetical protein